ncbi:unnamed protein product [Acanthosepion pharaonis]|uniref:Uncharacterized protein n=1 Tax=Acanthosepion pharaonis TaxID=158019 RepID=A0A812CXG6_ACAPH|nr:unnamed protein product [Sepia pharaonis]
MNAATTARLRAVETPACRRTRQFRDATAIATARAAERPLRRSFQNATNAATTGRSRAAETFDHMRAHQSRDVAATARSRVSETELQQATCNSRNAAATSAARNSKGPKTRAKSLSWAANMATVRLSQTPQAHHICLDSNIQCFAARGVPCPKTWIGVLLPSGRVPCRDVILSVSIEIDADKQPRDEDERHYNAPVCNEILSSNQELALFAEFQRPIDHMTHCSTLYFSLMVTMATTSAFPFILQVANL